MFAARSTDELFELLAACDGQLDSLGPDGDPVDILSHQLQCADVLRRAAPRDVELQIAGLVHDVGHVLAKDRGSMDASVTHGDVGARYIEPLLGPRVARLTALHVPAKRYLVTTDPAYATGLSTGSTHSLMVQGGVLETSERAALEADPHLADALTLRRADEAAKEVGRPVARLDAWRPVVERLVAELGHTPPAS